MLCLEQTLQCPIKASLDNAILQLGTNATNLCKRPIREVDGKRSPQIFQLVSRQRLHGSANLLLLRGERPQGYFMPLDSCAKLPCMNRSSTARVIGMCLSHNSTLAHQTWNPEKKENEGKCASNDQIGHSMPFEKPSRIIRYTGNPHTQQTSFRDTNMDTSRQI